MLFRDKLNEIRTAQRQDQVDVAVFVGVDRSAVTNWENGKSLPQKSKWKLIAEYLSISIDDLSVIIEHSKNSSDFAKPIDAIIGNYRLYQWTNHDNLIMQTNLKIYKSNNGRGKFEETLELSGKINSIRGTVEYQMPNIYLEGRGFRGFREYEYIIIRHLYDKKWMPAIVLGIGTFSNDRPAASAAMLIKDDIVKPPKTGDISEFNLPIEVREYLFAADGISPYKILCPT